MAQTTFEKCKAVAERMVAKDSDRDGDFLAYEQMKHCQWESPAEMADVSWWRKVVNTDVSDAIKVTGNILTATEPHVTIQPMAASQVEKDRANEWEKALEWQLANANRRRSTTIQKDVVESVATYFAAAVSVINLPHQIKAQKTIESSDPRYEAAMRYGDFMITVHNPRDVHVERSPMMVERVLLRQVRLAQEVMDEWGKLGGGLSALAETGDTVIYNDLWELNRRTVWVDEVSEPILAPTDHELGFIPWAAVMGGSDIEHDENHKYKPIGYATHQSQDWVTSNIVKSLYVSEVIKNAFAPRIEIIGPDAQNVEVNIGDADQTIRMPAGHQTKELNPRQIDRAGVEVDSIIGNKIAASTLPAALSGSSSTSQAFATLNLQTQTGLIQLDPTKKLAQQTLAEMFMIMLQWARLTDTDLSGYGSDKRKDLGAVYTIPAEAIEERDIYLTVKLDDSDPTDKQQKANTTLQLVSGGIYSVERGLEELGDTNPQATMEQAMYERLVRAMFDAEIQKMQAGVQMQLQAAQAQMQQQQQAQMLAEQQAMQGAIPGGQGFAPGMGGQPPAQANPNITREQMTGQAMNGVPLA